MSAGRRADPAPRSYEIVKGTIAGSVRAPTSKSVTNRVLVIAALAAGTSAIDRPLRSDDAEAMIDAVAAYGARVTNRAARHLTVAGTAGRPRAPVGPVNARLSGTTMRFVTALGALADGPSEITGATPLLRRPIGPLLEGLRQLGACDRASEFPPVRLPGGGLDGGEVDFTEQASTQYASALLLVAPYARGHVTVLADRTGSAAGYLDLTVDVMRQWGAQVLDEGAGWTVAAGRGYHARRWVVEHDASAAAHLYALAAATGGSVTVENAGPPTHQPDAAITEVLVTMGATVERNGDAVTVRGPPQLTPVDVDLHAMPDQVTTVAALAALAGGTSRITGVGVARGHETDRLAALATELPKLGVVVDQEPAALVIHGGTATGPARLATYDDHRLAMAFAAVGAALGDIVIEDPGCVAKTYPAFWKDAARLGAALREVPA